MTAQHRASPMPMGGPETSRPPIKVAFNVDLPLFASAAVCRSTVGVRGRAQTGQAPRGDRHAPDRA
jgi:hypothetical protein